MQDNRYNKHPPSHSFSKWILRAIQFSAALLAPYDVYPADVSSVSTMLAACVLMGMNLGFLLALSRE